MLDIKLIRDNKDSVLSKLKTRKIDESIVLEALEIDKERRDRILIIEDLKASMNKASNEMAMFKKQGKEQEFKNGTLELKKLSDKIKEEDEILKGIESKLNKRLHYIPNIPQDTVPVGNSENDNITVKEFGVKPEFDFNLLDHVDIGEKLNILDLKRASKIAGARFPMLLGMGAKLERALINFMLDVHAKQGYTEIVPPFLANPSSMFGTGQLPKFEEELFKCKDDDYYLIPTAEVPLTNIRRDEIVDLKELPLKYMAYTPCFRREAGSYGKDTRGLIRNHQFNKVEIVKIVEPSKSKEELESLVCDAKEILDLLELHYRIIELCTSDLGFSSSKTYDLEVWMPFEKRYREISSCSSFTDFQARRLNMRYKNENKKTELVHTLNGSGLAVGRTFAAILENYQTKEGNIRIPKVLVPYMEEKLVISNL